MKKVPVLFGLMMTFMGLAICGYLVVEVSPFEASGQDNREAIFTMFIGLFTLATGIGSLLAYKLHRRWPILGGGADEDLSFRHGVLTGIGAFMMALLALYDMLDFAMAASVVTLLIFLESYLQNRRRAS